MPYVISRTMYQQSLQANYGVSVLHRATAVCLQDALFIAKPSV